MMSAIQTSLDTLMCPVWTHYRSSRRPRRPTRHKSHDWCWGPPTSVLWCMQILKPARDLHDPPHDSSQRGISIYEGILTSCGDQLSWSPFTRISMANWLSLGRFSTIYSANILSYLQKLLLCRRGQTWMLVSTLIAQLTHHWNAQPFNLQALAVYAICHWLAIDGQNEVFLCLGSSGILAQFLDQRNALRGRRESVQMYADRWCTLPQLPLAWL